MRCWLILVAISSALFSSVSKADVINYGDFMGDNFFFNNVIESSSSIPVPAPNLFGPPNVVGNMLVFNPVNFEAKQTGTGVDLVDGQLSLSLVAKDGYLITGILISESGDFTVATPFAGGQAFINASATGFATTTAGVFSNGFSFPALSTTPSGIYGSPWSGNFPINFDPTNAVGFTLDNTLTAAAATATDAAFIKKKGFKITVTTSAVPEPTAATLLLVCGIAGLPLYRRR